MPRKIGSASDFFRLRLMTVDTTEEVDFEWREDILYRRPPSEDIVDEMIYVVEVVLLDDEEVSVPLERFASPAEAHEWMDARTDELQTMTKSEFEAAYLPAGLF